MLASTKLAGYKRVEALFCVPCCFLKVTRKTMAGRNKKLKVDYFPHYCNHGKTLFIIEGQFGNDGYAFWFKLLEVLGSTANHYIDCSNQTSWQYLIAKSRITPDKADAILNLLASVDAISPELWQYRVIWSDNFIENISDAYKRRIDDLVNKSTILDIYVAKQKKDVNKNTNNVDINTQIKRKEIKRKESKVLGDSKLKTFTPPTVEEVRDYCNERKNGIDPQYFVDSNTAKGWVIGKNETPAKDWKAMIRTWEGNNYNKNITGANLKTKEEAGYGDNIQNVTRKLREEFEKENGHG